MSTELDQGRELAAVTAAWKSGADRKLIDLEAAYNAYLHANPFKPLYLPRSVRDDAQAREAMINAFYFSGANDRYSLSPEQTAEIFDATILQAINLRAAIADNPMAQDADKELYTGSIAMIRLLAAKIYEIPSGMGLGELNPANDHDLLRNTLFAISKSFAHNGAFPNPILCGYFEFLRLNFRKSPQEIADAMIAGRGQRAENTEQTITHKPATYYASSKRPSERIAELEDDFTRLLLTPNSRTKDLEALILPPSIRAPNLGFYLEDAGTALQNALVKKARSTASPTGYSFLADQIAENMRVAAYIGQFVRPRYQILSNDTKQLDELVGQLNDGALFVAQTADFYITKTRNKTVPSKDQMAAFLLDAADKLYALDGNQSGAKKVLDLRGRMIAEKSAPAVTDETVHHKVREAAKQLV